MQIIICVKNAKIARNFHHHRVRVGFTCNSRHTNKNNNMLCVKNRSDHKIWKFPHLLKISLTPSSHLPAFSLHFSHLHIFVTNLEIIRPYGNSMDFCSTKFKFKFFPIHYKNLTFK